ncbi:MAG TPA: hypothetical protein VLH77_07075, partial [Gammaproteobacteria bacterium]|nr:hypothetical protein [Gammaproteobacteria bacterium]
PSALAQLANTNPRFFYKIPELQNAAPEFEKDLGQLLWFVAHGKKQQATALVSRSPELLLFEGETTDYTQFTLDGQRYKRKLQGTALQLALGAEDCGRDGCDLYLMPSNDETEEETTLKKLALYSDDNLDSPFQYFIAGEQYTIERGNGENELNSVHFDTLKAMYGSDILCNKPLNLDNNFLTPEQRKAYSALLKITSQRVTPDKKPHTLFVNEEGMIEMLMRHLQKLPDGEKIIAEQTLKQFPEGWEEQEENRHQEDLEQLRIVRTALTAKGTSEDPDGSKYRAALLEFKKYLAPKGVIREGKHWNARLLDAAFEMGHQEWYNDDQDKNDAFYNEIVGYLQTLAPANYAMAKAQGLHYLLQEGEKFNRDLEYRDREGSYFPLSSSPGFRLGVDSWRGGWGAGSHARGFDGAGFSKLYWRKNNIVAAIYAAARQTVECLPCSDVACLTSPSAIAAGGKSQQLSINR